MSLKDYKVGTAVAVSDMARAKDFYEGKLGLEPGQENDEMAMYECGEGTGLVVYVSEHAGSNKATLAGFDVPDFDGVRNCPGGTRGRVRALRERERRDDRRGRRLRGRPASRRPGSRIPTATSSRSTDSARPPSGSRPAAS